MTTPQPTNPNPDPGAGPEPLDLAGIETRMTVYEYGVSRQSAYDDIVDLVSEVKRLRAEMDRVRNEAYLNACEVMCWHCSHKDELVVKNEKYWHKYRGALSMCEADSIHKIRLPYPYEDEK